VGQAVVEAVAVEAEVVGVVYHHRFHREASWNWRNLPLHILPAREQLTREQRGRTRV